MSATPKLQRTAFKTNRHLDFCSQKELTAQTGHPPESWPLVVLKELVDNALDACEEAGVPPVVNVSLNDQEVVVEDNGPGIPAGVIDGVLDFSVRVSSREAYVAPDRGAQGNALKTIVAMPFVLGGESGHVEVEARGTRHHIRMRVDHIRQEPVIERTRESSDTPTGTKVRVRWPDSASSILRRAGARFVQVADDYTFLNPHLALTVTSLGKVVTSSPTDLGWKKWLASDLTSPHWYAPEHFERLVAAYIADDLDSGRRRTVRDFVAEFRGLARTTKQKAVLVATGLARTSLADLVEDGALRAGPVRRLLQALQQNSKPVSPLLLGPVGKDHLAARLKALGCEVESYRYQRVCGERQGVPWVIETAFGWCPRLRERRLVTGVNWSPGILNPFRELGQFGESLDSVLERQRAGSEEPVCVLLHLVCPRVEYTDRGKSAVVIPD